MKRSNIPLKCPQSANLSASIGWRFIDRNISKRIEKKRARCVASMTRCIRQTSRLLRSPNGKCRHSGSRPLPSPGVCCIIACRQPVWHRHFQTAAICAVSPSSSGLYILLPAACAAFINSWVTGARLLMGSSRRRPPRLTRRIVQANGAVPRHRAL